MLSSSLRKTAAGAILGLCIWAQINPAAAANEPTGQQSNAAKSLESILSQAAEDGFLVTKPDSITPAIKPAGSDKTHEGNAASKPVSDNAQAMKNCEAAQRLNIEKLSEVSALSDINAAKAGLGNKATSDADMSNLILTYIALGLGTEARAISRRIDAPLLSALSRLVAGEAEDDDIQRIKKARNCGPSFQVWNLAAQIADTDPLKHMSAIDKNVLKDLSKFPPQLRKNLELHFAIYAAETGDFLTAEQLLREDFPETKFGALPRRMDDDILYLYALILQHKGDARFVEILTHLAVRNGLYKTKAIQALANDSAASGRSLPPSFEGELKSIDDQFGDTKDGKAANLELIKFRIDKNEFNSAINTAKSNFTHDDIEKQQSVDLIGDKISTQLTSGQPSPQLYALNGYFYDPNFFKPYAQFSTLLLQVHTASLELGLPELAMKIAPELQSLTEDGTLEDIQSQLIYAQADYDVKYERFEEAVQSLESIKSNETAKALITNASLASGNRELVQKVFALNEASGSQNSEYLEFILRKGRWAEAKVFSSNLGTSQTAPKPSLPFALDMPSLNYLAAPVKANAETKLPYSADDLDGYLAALKTNAKLAKGLLNNAPTDS